MSVAPVASSTIETPTSPAQIVVRESQPADNLSYLREPRWSPSGPTLLYRRGTEVFTAGGFVNAGSSSTRVALEGRVLRVEWTPGNSAGLESIVYIVDGPRGCHGARACASRSRAARMAAPVPPAGAGDERGHGHRDGAVLNRRA